MSTIILRGGIGAIRLDRQLAGRDSFERIDRSVTIRPEEVREACRYACSLRGARKAWAKAFLVFCLVGGERPFPADFGLSETPRDVERELARFGAVDPDGFADGPELVRGKRRTPRKARKGCTAMEREHLRQQRENARAICPF